METVDNNGKMWGVETARNASLSPCVVESFVGVFNIAIRGKASDEKGTRKSIICLLRE